MEKAIKRIAIWLILTTSSLATAQPALSPPVTEKIDRLAASALAKFQTPAAAIAIVRDGKLAYVKSYGMSRLQPPAPAREQTRFLIGSISKQFTAAAILLLEEEGKLSLDDRVSKYFPELTRAGEITLRQLLSHTSGYQDSWPEDYLTPAMKHPGSAMRILDVWAKKPLDFEPGTQWQYSNTGFVIAGLIVEKVSGMRLFAFLKERIFAPLGMTSVFDVDAADLPAEDAIGYSSYALGPPRVTPKAALGWYLGYGQLAMTAHDLALWDIAMIERKILKQSSWEKLETEILLSNGTGSGYGLGVFTGKPDGHRSISHGGEMPGFLSNNVVYPEQRLAVVVLCNSDTTQVPRTLTRAILSLMAPGQASQPEPALLVQARQILTGLQAGKIERSLFTDDCNDYFSDEVLHDYAASLSALGEPESFVEIDQELRGGLVYHEYLVQFPQQKLTVSIRVRPDGKLQQYMVLRAPE